MIIFTSISCTFFWWNWTAWSDANNLRTTLVQIMAWCHQVTSHYLSQCWPRSMLLYGVVPGLAPASVLVDGVPLAVDGLLRSPLVAEHTLQLEDKIFPIYGCRQHHSNILNFTNYYKPFKGRVMQLCVSKLTIIGSDNGLSPGQCQAIIWSNAGILLIGPLGTNFSEISIEIHIFSFNKMHSKMLSAKWRPFCLDLNVLNVFSLSMKAPCLWWFS